MKKYGKLIALISLCNIVFWTIIAVADTFARELKLEILLVVLMLALPMALIVLYIKSEKRLCDKLGINKSRLIICTVLIWSIEFVIIGELVGHIVYHKSVINDIILSGLGYIGYIDGIVLIVFCFAWIKSLLCVREYIECFEPNCNVKMIEKMRNKGMSDDKIKIRFQIILSLVTWVIALAIRTVNIIFFVIFMAMFGHVTV